LASNLKQAASYLLCVVCTTARQNDVSSLEQTSLIRSTLKMVIFRRRRLIKPPNENSTLRHCSKFSIMYTDIIYTIKSKCWVNFYEKNIYNYISTCIPDPYLPPPLVIFNINQYLMSFNNCVFAFAAGRCEKHVYNFQCKIQNYNGRSVSVCQVFYMKILRYTNIRL